MKQTSSAAAPALIGCAGPPRVVIGHLLPPRRSIARAPARIAAAIARARRPAGGLDRARRW